LGELCNSLAEKLTNGELDHLSEETRELIGNKEVLDTAIQGSNDIHIGKLLAKEDETRAEEMTMFKSTLQGFKDEKLLKSRARLSEIKKLGNELKDDIESVLREISENREEFDINFCTNNLFLLGTYSYRLQTQFTSCYYYNSLCFALT